ncbi:MAG: hypothetical protein FWG17_05350 [Desulfovibrionaceae bacterium]|nr:hypothetical protein [Desulfovibrionaceae bacterium]
MLLNKHQIAERMSTTPDIARNILSEHGVNPIDLGWGRGRCFRWHASEVDAVIRQMHEDAQDKKPSGEALPPSKKKKKE